MATAIKPLALGSPVSLALSSSINTRFHGFSKQTPSRLFFSIQTPQSFRITVSSSLLTPIIPPPKPTFRSSALTGPTRSLATLAALTIAVTKVVIQRLSNPVIGDALCTGGSLFLASSLRDGAPGYLNTPLTVVAMGIKKWLDIYSGVLMVRVLLSWFPNIPWERQPLSAIRDLCDPYLNLFRNIIPPIFDTIDVSPLLAFAVLGLLASIVHASVG